MENIDIKYIDIEELGIWPISITDMQVSEGELKLSHHLKRERNAKIVKLAKQRFKERHGGRIFCEICGFDFFEKYGNIGTDFIEAHHKTPISKMSPDSITSIDDFLMVCSNCHSMLHTGTEWLTPEDLSAAIRLSFDPL